MSEEQRRLRVELTDAIDAVRRQLELLRAGPTIGEALDDRSVIADLEAELADLISARAAL